MWTSFTRFNFIKTNFVWPQWTRTVLLVGRRVLDDFGTRTIVFENSIVLEIVQWITVIGNYHMVGAVGIFNFRTFRLLHFPTICKSNCYWNRPVRSDPRKIRWIRINSFIWSVSRRLHRPDIPIPMILADENFLRSGILLIKILFGRIYDTWNWFEFNFD